MNDMNNMNAVIADEYQGMMNKMNKMNKNPKKMIASECKCDFRLSLAVYILLYNEWIWINMNNRWMTWMYECSDRWWISGNDK